MQFNIHGFSYLFNNNDGEYGRKFHSRLKDVEDYTSNFFEMTSEISKFLETEEGKALESIVTQNIEKLYSELCTSIESIKLAEEQEAQRPNFEPFENTHKGQKTTGHRRGRRNSINEHNQSFDHKKDITFYQSKTHSFEEIKKNIEIPNWESRFTDEPTINNETKIEETPVPKTEPQTKTERLFDINEKVESSQQGYIGDCWLLSGLNSLSYSQKGQKLINDAITVNDNGSYTVTFGGINKDVNITDSDLLQARKSGLYSTGDDDVLLMEVAFEKVIDDIQSGKIKIPGDTTNLSFIEKTDGQISSIDGGWLSDMIYLLTGDDLEFITNKSSFTAFLDEMEKNPQNYVAKLSFPSSSKGETEDFNSITDINGKEIYSLGDGGHAFAIKSVSNGIVTIVNPYDSNKEYQISYDELIYSARNIEYYKL